MAMVWDGGLKGCLSEDDGEIVWRQCSRVCSFSMEGDLGNLRLKKILLKISRVFKTHSRLGHFDLIFNNRFALQIINNVY